MTPERQFADLLAADASHPFVTYYDEASGERTELSGKSLANWVAKTHHLLVDELGLGVGDTALIALPAHWISVPIVLGCLTAGLALAPAAADGAGAESAAVGFVTPETVAAAAGLLDVYAVAPGTAAVGLRGAEPDDVLDYVVAVRPQADAWAGVAMRATADDPCLPGLTRGEVADRPSGLEPGARVLTTRDWTGPGDWLDTLFAPLAVRGSVVYVRNCADDAVIERRMSQERATVRV